MIHRLRAGSTFQVVVNGHGYPEPTLQWYKDGAKIEGETGASFVISAIDDDDEGAYTVVLSNYCKLQDPGWSCKRTSADAVLRINRPPSVMKSPVNTTVDPGQSAPPAPVAFVATQEIQRFFSCTLFFCIPCVSRVRIVPQSRPSSSSTLSSFFLFFLFFLFAFFLFLFFFAFQESGSS